MILYNCKLHIATLSAASMRSIFHGSSANYFGERIIRIVMVFGALPKEMFGGFFRLPFLLKMRLHSATKADPSPYSNLRNQNADREKSKKARQENEDEIQ